MADADEFTALRRTSVEVEPFAFSASSDDDFAASIEQVKALLAGPRHVVIGAFKAIETIGERVAPVLRKELAAAG